MNSNKTTSHAPRCAMSARAATSLLVLAGCLGPSLGQSSLPVDPDSDPYAEQDPLLSLTPEELRLRWSHNSDDSVISGDAEEEVESEYAARVL